MKSATPAVGEAAAATRLTDHLPRPHQRAASDRQFIRPPPAGLDRLCGTRRSSNASLSSTYPETIGATPADYSGTFLAGALAGINWEGKVDGQRWSKVKGEAKLEGIKAAGVHC